MHSRIDCSRRITANPKVRKCWQFDILQNSNDPKKSGINRFLLVRTFEMIRSSWQKCQKYAEGWKILLNFIFFLWPRCYWLWNMLPSPGGGPSEGGVGAHTAQPRSQAIIQVHWAVCHFTTLTHMDRDRESWGRNTEHWLDFYKQQEQGLPSLRQIFRGQSPSASLKWRMF